MIMQSMCAHLGKHGGSALISDYGHWGGKGDTFRVGSCMETIHKIQYYLYRLSERMK